MKQDSYRFQAPVYDRCFEPAAKRLRGFGLQLFPPQENLAILDVGCGTGTQLALYQLPGCRLVGIDTSAAMLGLARAKLGEMAELYLEDAAHMRFDSATFDLAILALVIHEMSSDLRIAVLQECRRVVKKNGRLMLLDYHFGPYSFPRGWIWRALVHAMEMCAGTRHYANYRDFIKKRGLEGLAAGQQLAIEKSFIAESGVAAVYILRP
jgi:ubiquinone/menaquinone biosynthesis C-methylase UbiE